MGKNAQKATANLLKEANKPDIFEKRSNEISQELTALDKDLSNLTDAQLNELAKKQQNQLKRSVKPPKPPKPPKMATLNKTAGRFETLFRKEASKAKAIQGFDETLSKLLAMKKTDPKRPELMKAVEEMAPEALAANPEITPAFMKVRDSILKTGEAESKSQQRLMGMVHAFQNGELDMAELDPELQNKIRSMAKTMTKSESKDYAETKHKGLPEKKAHFLSKFAFKGTPLKVIKKRVQSNARKNDMP